MEEDTGKSTHLGDVGSHPRRRRTRSSTTTAPACRSSRSSSRPDIRSADDARAYVTELRARSSWRPRRATPRWKRDRCASTRTSRSAPRAPTTLGTRCEIKNLNSIRSLGRAIEYEAKRQIDLLEAGDRVRQETRHWNEDEGRTHTLRSKEEADDYRYFPEPDLVPLEPDDAWISRVASALPRLPADRRIDLASTAGVAPTTGAVAVAGKRDLDSLAAGSDREAGGDPARVGAVDATRRAEVGRLAGVLLHVGALDADARAATPGCRRH